MSQQVIIRGQVFIKENYRTHFTTSQVIRLYPFSYTSFQASRKQVDKSHCLAHSVFLFELKRVVNYEVMETSFAEFACLSVPHNLKVRKETQNLIADKY